MLIIFKTGYLYEKDCKMIKMIMENKLSCKMENRYFNQFITQFKQDLADGKEKCIIKYELYGPDMTSQY